MSTYLFFESIIAKSERRSFSPLCLGLLLFSSVFMTFSSSAQAQAVEIGSGILDADKVIAPKWIRVDFDPLISGDHLFRITSDASADIRFAVFRIRVQNTAVRIGRSSSSATLAEWTGALDTAEQYYLGVWAVSGSADFTATIEALAALEIVSQPTDQTVTEGSDASFSVTATGNGTLTYQWYVNEQAIADATADTHNVVAATSGDNGNVYRVDVTDDNGTLSSDNATLTVDTVVALEIVSQPIDQTVTEGDDASFSVTAAGSGTLTYQWYVNDQAIAGATAAIYNVIAATSGDNGNVYRVDVTDDNGTLSSANATLTVDTLVVLEIVSQPSDQTVTEGEDASFSVTAAGSGTLTYQWYVNDQVITGATSASYNVVATTLGDNGTVYRADVTDDNGTLSSVNAMLEVLEFVVPPTVVGIGQGIVDFDKVAGPRWVRVTFDSLAAVTHTITVNWDSTADVRFNVRDADDNRISSTIKGTKPGVWSGVLDANAEYSIGLWSTSGIANYDATIEAVIPISFEIQPFDRTVTESDDVTFYAEATGSGILSYQWYADGNPLPGETADSLTVFAASLAESGTQYHAEASNGSETVASDVATLSVNEPLVLGLFSQEVDTSTWMLEGPAPTLDFDATASSDAWGKVLLRIGDMLLVGGDFQGIKSARFRAPTDRPFLAALDAVSGQPLATFQVPIEVDSVVRALALSPDGNQVYVGGDFGFMALNATTGALNFTVSVTNGNVSGRVF